MATRVAMRLIKAARTGDAGAQLTLGRLYLSGGEKLGANPNAALLWLARAWKNGCPEAAAEIAENVPPPLHTYHADGICSDYVRACQLAAGHGSATASYNIGELLLAGRGVMRDVDAALAAFGRAAEAGHRVAARRMGELLAEGVGGETDPVSVRRWLEQAAGRGDEAAARRLADLLWQTRDAAAMPWLLPFAEAGEAEAMCRLGELLSVAGSTAEATRWLRRAARKDHARALWIYGRAHIRWLRSESVAALDVPSSPLTAARLLERAADQNWKPAYWDLARLYMKPGFSGRDLRRARHYEESAAQGGIAEAQLALAERLAARSNDMKAHLEGGNWLKLASDSGLARADAILDTISDRAPRYSADEKAAQQRMLRIVETECPRLAARLSVAAGFGLTRRETLFLEPLGADQDWCMLVDLSKHFRYRPWRLIRMETDEQHERLAAACHAFRTTADSGDLAGSNSQRRARQLDSAARFMNVDPAAFIRDWHTPS